MPTFSLVSRSFACSAVFVLSAAALAQSGHEWQKSYNVGPAAALSLTIGDAGAQIHSCGACSAMRIHVTSDDDLSRYLLEERQEGNHVFFTLKERMPRFGISLQFKPHHTKVEIETPVKLALDGQSSDGSIALSGTTGDVRLKTSDGSLDVSDVSGAFQLASSDGSITIHHASGTLSARTSDGSVNAQGKFGTFDVHSSDGSVSLALDPSTQLAGASSVETKDGSVEVRVAHEFAAAVDIASQDGHIKCELPLMTNGYSTREGSQIQGTLNAGTVPLRLRASDGNVVLKSL